MEDQYIEILEKTNNQLGLWINSLGVSVGVLTFLIALIAIVVGGYIVWNSAVERKNREEKLEKFWKDFIRRRGADGKDQDDVVRGLTVQEVLDLKAAGFTVEEIVAMFGKK